MFINNQKDFSFGLPNHALQEICEHAIPKPLPKYHKRKMSFVRNGRNPIASEALSCSRDNRGFTLRTLGATWSMVRSQSHLDTPINLDFFALRLCTYPWILMRKPVLHCFCLPWFQRSARWTTPSFGCERFRTLRSVYCNPVPDRMTWNAEYLCNFDLLLFIKNGLDCFLSDGPLCFWRQRTGIMCFHAQVTPC